MASYLGTQLGACLAGAPFDNPFAGMPFPGAPLGLYDGRPWFLPLVGAWYRLLDFLGRDRAATADRKLSCCARMQPCIMIVRLTSGSPQRLSRAGQAQPPIPRTIVVKHEPRPRPGHRALRYVCVYGSNKATMSLSTRRVPWARPISGAVMVGLVGLLIRNWHKIQIKALEALHLIEAARPGWLVLAALAVLAGFLCAGQISTGACWLRWATARRRSGSRLPRW